MKTRQGYSVPMLIIIGAVFIVLLWTTLAAFEQQGRRAQRPLPAVTVTQSQPTPPTASITPPPPPDGQVLCGAPINPFGYSLCGGGMVVREPTSAVCSVFQCEENFDAGNGYMVACSDGVYSMTGGTLLPCREHGGVRAIVRH